MKDDARINGRVCPLCQKIYYEPSALTRTDNNASLEIIHRCRNNAKY